MDTKTYQQLAMRTRCPQGTPVIGRLFPNGIALYPGVPLEGLERNTALLHGCIGLAGEAGELAEALIGWLDRGKALDTINIVEEIGDCCWYAAEIGEAIGVVFGNTSILASSISTACRYIQKCTGSLSSEMQRWLFYGKGLDVDAVKTYVTTLLSYAGWLAIALGTDLEEIRRRNINKLKARYPDKFTEELAAEENRERAKERSVLEGIPTKEMLVTGVSKLSDLGSSELGEKFLTVGSDMGEHPMFHQTGQGWAEPPEDMLPEPLEVENPFLRDAIKHYETTGKSLYSGTDGRRALTTNYDRYCIRCKRTPVHKRNESCICPDCVTQDEVIAANK